MATELNVTYQKEGKRLAKEYLSEEFRGEKGGEINIRSRFLKALVLQLMKEARNRRYRGFVSPNKFIETSLLSPALEQEKLPEQRGANSSQRC